MRAACLLRPFSLLPSPKMVVFDVQSYPSEWSALDTGADRGFSTAYSMIWLGVIRFLRQKTLG